MDTFSLILVRHRAIFGSTEYSQLNETEPYCTCGRIDTCFNLSYKGREGEEKIAAPPQRAARSRHGLPSGGMALLHHEPNSHRGTGGGTFCDVPVTWFGTTEVCKAVARTGVSAFPQSAKKPQIKYVCIQKYVQIRVHRPE